MRAKIVATALLLVIAGAPMMVAQDIKPASQAAPVTLDDGAPIQPLPEPRLGAIRGSEALGFIIYDDGVVAGALGVDSVTVGNQFDTAAGNPLTASGTVMSASVYWAGVSGNAFLSFYDQQAGTVANPVLSVSLPAVTGFNTYTTFGTGVNSVNYVGSSFLFGGWQFGADLAGVSTGTTGGQGFHGMTINDIAGTGFNRPGTFNAVAGAGGNVILVPVELMSFDLVD